jgi:16S rRNA (cytosine1402-N4)-methyltransferase
MRMSLSGESAADVVNGADERSLTRIIATYGEEKNARRIARAIIAARPISGTAELAAIISEAQGPVALRQAIHPATRTFQALRIHVNDELGELERGLDAALKILKPQGRLVVVSFHSLEDRMVKQFLGRRSTVAPRASRHAPTPSSAKPVFELLTRRPRTPSAAEIASNPRARSAKLRAGLKLAA